MKKLAVAFSLLAGLVLAAPAGISSAQAQNMQLAQADVTVKKKVVVRRGGDTVRRKVVVRHGDRGMRRGWAHSRHHGATRTKTVIKRGNGTTVVKKKIVR